MATITEQEVVQMGKTLVSTRLAPETYQRLQELGRRLERKPAWLVRKAVVEYLEREQKDARKGRQAA